MLAAEADRERVAKHWDQYTVQPRTARIHWWESQLIIRHINRVVCGKPLNGFSAGLQELIREATGNRVFEKGISVGCGAGLKEIRLLRSGMVKHFMLYELSTERIAAGQANATRLGTSDRTTFRNADAFAENSDEAYDFVHWNNSLHHMMDVEQAVAWSRRVLKPGGVFYMDDFVGPTRWQWSDKSLALGSKVRAALPEKYLINPHSQDPAKRLFPRHVERKPAEWVAKKDPSEAADSSRIIASIRSHFPNATIKLTGGVLYHIALMHVLQNFDEDSEADAALLNFILMLDETLIEVPGVESHYAVAFATKS